MFKSTFYYLKNIFKQKNNFKVFTLVGGLNGQNGHDNGQNRQKVKALTLTLLPYK